MSRWSDVASFASDMANFNREVTRFAFRGQSDVSWKVEPKLLRMLRHDPSESHFNTFEGVAEKDFFSRRRGILPAAVEEPVDQLGRWALMQHYGVPTRMLDWTESFYVALYFAVKENWACDGAVFGFNRWQLRFDQGKLGDAVQEETFSPRRRESSSRLAGLLCFSSPQPSPRELIQQGLFTVCEDAAYDRGMVLDEMPQRADTTVTFKLVIPATLKAECLVQLRAMNVGAHSLFPDVGGIGMAVEERLRTKLLRFLFRADDPQAPDV